MNEESKAKRMSVLSQLIQTNFLIIIFTIIFYLIVSTYYISYFNQLSLPFFTLNLPLAFYLAAGTNLFRILLFIIALSAFIIIYYNLFSLLTERNYAFISKNKFYLVTLPHIILLLIISILFIIYRPELPISLPISFKWVIPQNISIFAGIYPLFMVFVIVMFLILIRVLMFESMRSIFLPLKHAIIFGRTGTISILVLILVIISLVNILPTMVGYYSAQDLASGFCDHFEINLNLKGENNSLDGNTFILVTQCNGNYYLIEKSNLTQGSVPPTVIIVPETQIITATVKKIYYNKR